MTAFILQADSVGPGPARPSQVRRAAMTGSGSTSRSDGPGVVCDTHAEMAKSAAAATGVLWGLSEPGRQLDANLVRLAPGRRIEMHTEPNLDVLVIVVAGTGVLGAGDRSMPLAAGLVAWLPRESGRGLTAGQHGLSYVTVHRRRPGLSIGRRPPDITGDSTSAVNRDAAGQLDPPEDPSGATSPGNN